MGSSRRHAQNVAARWLSPRPEKELPPLSLPSPPCWAGSVRLPRVTHPPSSSAASPRRRARQSATHAVLAQAPAAARSKHVLV